MCGICGIFNFRSDRPASHREVEAMAEVLRHRGPDGGGIHVEGPLGLGHRRLSIIDISDAGRQPIANEDESVWLSYNGEIYNYRELRSALEERGHRFRSHTDSEVIVHLYEDHGLDFVDHLEGMFAFALWDRRQRRLALVRDRIGIKPLYYFADSDGLLFASDCRAFLSVPRFPKTVDTRALASFACHLAVTGDRSVFEGVRKIKPGSMIVVENGQVSSRRYWALDRQDAPSLETEDEAVERLREHLHRVSRSHLVADVPVGAFLSGGLDSSSISTLAARESDHRLETFSVTFSQVPRVDEARFARLVADSVDTEHHEFDMDYDFVATLDEAVGFSDEPFAIWSAFGLFEICRMASSRVKVVLSGDGADELFAGYPRHSMALGGVGDNRWRRAAADGSRLLSRPFLHSQHMPEPFRSLALRVLWRGDRLDWSTARRYLSLVRYVDSPVIADVFDREFLTDNILPELTAAEERFAELYDGFGASDEINRRLHVDVTTSLVDEMLTKVDRMSMAFGLEVRVPFLDHHLVEFAMSIPGSEKSGALGAKHILKRAMAPDLPTEIIRRSKSGFNLPLAEWFRDNLGPYLRQRLSPASLRESGIFDPRAVARLIDQHSAGARDHSAILFAVLVWVIWYERWIRTETV
jgi:asparagine synthase (glutamine-hydrolysing)